jgi:aldehyde:ferredoxin oxidoreductase
MEGPDFEYHLFRAATGEELGPDGFTQAAERVVNLERAIQVRAFGRSRADDESVIPYFERPEHWGNPLLEGERKRLDREQFLPLLDEFYRLRGWDPATGLPTASKLDALGLSDVAQELSHIRTENV